MALLYLVTLSNAIACLGCEGRTDKHKSGVFSFARHSPFFYNGLHASQVLMPMQSPLTGILVINLTLPVKVDDSTSCEQRAVWLRACYLYQHLSSLLLQRQGCLKPHTKA